MLKTNKVITIAIAFFIFPDLLARSLAMTMPIRGGVQTQGGSSSELRKYICFWLNIPES